MKRIITFFVLFVFLAGCSQDHGFPEHALNFRPYQTEGKPAALPRVLDYDTNGDDTSDFRMQLGDTGQIESIQYLDDGAWSQPIYLAKKNQNESIHLLIILSGIDYPAMQKAYQDGAMRFCPPPIRMLTPFPALIGPALSEVLGSKRPVAYSEIYFRKTDSALVKTRNGQTETYESMIDYQAGVWTAFLDKISDNQAFKSDLGKFKKAFSDSKTLEFIAYLETTRPLIGVGSAAQQRVLWTIDQLCKELIWKRRGQIKITLISDVPAVRQICRTAELKEELEEEDFGFKKVLSEEKEVGFFEMKHSRYAGFWTLKPAKLAHELAQISGVELVSFVSVGRLVVIGPNGQMAYVEKKGKGFRYESVTGDPLKLNKLLNPKQFYTSESLMKATALYEYPAPLQRLWRAHHENVQNPPDVIVSLGKEYFAADGFQSESKKNRVTGGALSQDNATVFLMTMLGKIPPILQSRDMPDLMKSLIKTSHWPLRLNPIIMPETAPALKSTTLPAAKPKPIPEN